MKRVILIMTLLLSLLCLSSCSFVLPDFSNSNEKEESKENKEDEKKDEDVKEEEKPVRIVSEIKVLENGRATYQVCGKVMTYLGAQVRYDGLTNRGEGEHLDTNAPAKLTKEEVKQYFVEAKKFGVNLLAVSLDWRDLEPTKDNYDFKEIDMLMDISNEVGIKFEILWFSTNMCGDTHSFHLPDYIYNDDVTYPKMSSNTFYFSAMYGYVGKYIVLDNEALMEREYKAVKTLMDHIAEYNEKTGLHYPVTGMQIHNESDGLLRWRYDQKNICIGDTRVTKERLLEMTLNAINNVGKAVKESEYVVVTRCNLTTSFSVNAFPQATFASPLDWLNLEYVDCIGDDPYTEIPDFITNDVISYSTNNNFSHIAENMGDYGNSDALIMKAVTAGGGYLIYDFATPQYFVYINGNGSYRMDQGVINPDFSYKEHSNNVKNVITILNKAGYILFTETRDNMYAFNSDKNCLEKTEEEITLGGHQLKLSTNDGALGYVINYQDGILVASTGKMQVELLGNESMGVVAYDVSFNYDEMVKNAKVYPALNVFEAQGLKLYYITIK